LESADQQLCCLQEVEKQEQHITQRSATLGTWLQQGTGTVEQYNNNLHATQHHL
jgi:hypothetical protein